MPAAVFLGLAGNMSLHYVTASAVIRSKLGLAVIPALGFCGSMKSQTTIALSQTGELKSAAQLQERIKNLEDAGRAILAKWNAQQDRSIMMRRKDWDAFREVINN